MPTTQTMKIEPKRVLVLADFACSTGFAQVSQNIVAQVYKTGHYAFDIIAINYYGHPSEWHRLYPGVRLFPAAVISQNDVFGRRALLEMASTGLYDVVWILQDTFNIEPIAQNLKDIQDEMVKKGIKAFKTIFYYPIDATPKENWITKSVSLMDFPVAYTQYGYDASLFYDERLKDRLSIIPHGINPAEFNVLPEEVVTGFRKEYFAGKADGKFLVMNVNRNQPRKDIPRTMQIFRAFKNQVPEAVLYLHMRFNDVGWNLLELARNYDLKEDEDFLYPKNFDERVGLPVQVMNALYNSADVVMTTTLGEGWGLSVTEAMATKTPVIAPDHTSLSEMIDHGTRGALIPAGLASNDWITLTQDNERLRPFVSVPHFVESLVQHVRYPEMFKNQIEAAYNYSQTLNWDYIGSLWVKVFDHATEVSKPLAKRNDPCPECAKEGITIKYKKCQKHYHA